MPLIKSISGIRGTIGGFPGDSLTPLDLVKFTTAYVAFLREAGFQGKLQVVVGRDARISGPVVRNLVVGTLMGMGADVIDIGLTTTPTAEIAVTETSSHGGIILTASHNPKNWNALKFLNRQGEFLSASDGARVLELTERTDISYARVHELGTLRSDDSFIKRHIDMILALPLVDVAAIKQARMRVAVDAVNSTGGIAIPPLLEALGVNKVDVLFGEPNGDFPHNPEPLPEHLTEICSFIEKNQVDVGFVVDPDVDRLAIINEMGEPFGEEYTLVAVADYILSHQPGNTVSNLSSTGALKIVTERAGGSYFTSAVGEVNVVEVMKLHQAVIGGEGNGGVIYPELHYGRDALVGIALFLSHLAKSGKKCSALRDTYPVFYISKNKIEFEPGTDLEKVLSKLMDKYGGLPINNIDGVKIHFGEEWVHLRKSNTEPILRIYAESNAPGKADNLARKIISDFSEILKEI